MNTNQNEEQLLDRFNQKQKKITQNRLVLTTSLNFITLIITIFSMSYYQWASIILTIQSDGLQLTSTSFEISSQRQVSIWLNLLFMKVKTSNNYQSYSSASQQFCSQNDLYCLTFFYELAFIGALCFFILACGFFITVYCSTIKSCFIVNQDKTNDFFNLCLRDIYFYNYLRTLIAIQIFQFLKLTYFLIKTKLLQNQNFLKTNQFKLQNKSDFRHIFAISTYLISISLNAFGLRLIDSSITFQLCFWLYMSTLLLFAIVIVYTRIQMSKIQKQNMILKLISQEKHIHNQQWEQRKRLQSIQMSSDSRKSETEFGI